MLFTLIWALIDFGIMGFGIFSAIIDKETSMLIFMVPFFTLHLMPVWIYLFGIIMTRKRYNNTYYVVTNRAIYVSGGTFVKKIQTKSFSEISHIDLHKGIFDQTFNVGDVICTSSHRSSNSSTA